MMAARTRLIQLSIAIVNILIAALVFTSVWPFPSGDFKVDLPSANEISWTYDEGIVHIIAPFTIDNRWIYDVDDLSIFYLVTNYSGYHIAEQRMPIGTIPAGQVTESALDFNFDLMALYYSGAAYMVFNDDLLSFYVEVSCMYTAKLVKFFASYQVSVPWEALIQDYGVDEDRSSYTPPSSFVVGYWLETSDLLSSLPPADVVISIYGNDTLLGDAHTTVALGGYHEGNVTIDVPFETLFEDLWDLRLYDHYYVTISVLGYEMVEDVTPGVEELVGGWLP